jgi:malic enzyme
LRELLDIPVFHDDQHGTAIIAAAGLINALDLTGRDIKSTKLVCNGAGAAGIACPRTAQGDRVHPRQHHPVRHQRASSIRAAPRA